MIKVNQAKVMGFLGWRRGDATVEEFEFFAAGSSLRTRKGRLETRERILRDRRVESGDRKGEADPSDQSKNGGMKNGRE